MALPLQRVSSALLRRCTRSSHGFSVLCVCTRSASSPPPPPPAAAAPLSESPGANGGGGGPPAAAEAVKAEAETEKVKAKAETEKVKAETKAETEGAKAEAEAETETKAEKAAAVKAEAETEPARWLQEPAGDLSPGPIVDERGQFIVSHVQWPTGELAYTTPPAPDGKLAPRFGYNIVQVRKDVSWWKHYHKYPRVSVAYINIQVLFLIGIAWLSAFLVEEYRRTTDEMKTPGAMVGEQRGRGPVSRQSQKIRFSQEEMSALVDKAQNNWFDGKAEASYVGSKEYKMKKIPRPKELSLEDIRKR